MMGQFTLDETSYTASEQFYIVLLYYIELRCNTIQVIVLCTGGLCIWSQNTWKLSLVRSSKSGRWLMT